MAIKIGSLLIRLAVEHGILQEGLARSERDIAKTTKNIQRRGREIADFGQKMSLAISLPLAALAVSSVKAAKESADAVGQVEASLASMGNQAGRTSEQLQQLASRQMRQSLYDDDQILREVTANLLTFGRIAGTEFDRAQQAVVDYSAKTGRDLLGTTIMIGKALNDPAKGMAALGKAGVQLTDDQKALIKSFLEAGDVAGAQRVILAELEKQVRGSAQAARDADPGAALAQSFAQFQEDVGAKLLPLLPPLLDAVTKVVDLFSKLSPEVQTAVIAFAGIAAVAGPIVAFIGTIVSAGAGLIATIGGSTAAVSLAGAAFNTLLGILGAFAAPIAAVAAAGALIYFNWDKIAPVLEGLWQTAQDTIGPPLQSLVGAIGEALSALWQGPLGQGIRGAMSILGELGSSWLSIFGTVIEGALRGAIAYIEVAFEQIGNILNLAAALLRGDFSGAWEAMKAIVVTAVTGLGKVIEAVFPGALGYVRQMYEGVKLWLQDKLGAVFKWVGDKVREVTGFFFEMYDAVVGNSYVPDMVDGIAAEFARLDALMVDPARKATASVTEATRQMAADVQGLLDRLFPEIAAARQQASELDLLRNAEGAGLISGATRSSARNRLLGPARTSFDNGTDGPLDAVEKVKVAVADMNKAFEDGAAKAEVQTVRIARTVEDMARDISNSLRGLADGIKKSDFFSILDGVLGVFSSLGNAGVFGGGVQSFLQGVPGNANGTAYHPGGLMMVGERGPEILAAPRGSRVIPNHELREAGQAARVQVMVGIDPETGNLTAYVDDRIGASAPGIAQAGASLALGRLTKARERSLA